MRDANFRYDHCLICKLWAHPRLISYTGLWCQQNERRLLTFYLPKLLLVGPVWLCAVLMATWQKYNEHLDPTYSYQLDTSYFYVCIVDNSFLWITQSYWVTFYNIQQRSLFAKQLLVYRFPTSANWIQQTTKKILIKILKQYF